MNSFLRASLRDVKRTDSADIRGSFVRLDRNERVEPLTLEEESYLKNALSQADFISYPDPLPLQALVASEYGLPTDHALLTNGSDAGIRRLLHACIAPGDVILVPDPTYEMYAVYGQIFQANVIRLAYPMSRRISIEQYLEELKRLRPKILCIVNPDQPTGGRLSHAELLSLVTACREIGTLLIVDEAYWVPGEQSITMAISNHPNLAVVRSFSKVYGFGGIRLGVLMGQPALIEAAIKVKGLHEVSTVALTIGRLLIERKDIVERYQAALSVGRSLLLEFARQHNFGFPDCPSAFQILELPSHLESSAIIDSLKRRGWLIRGNFKSPCMRQCLRVSMVGAENMNRFIREFEGTLAEFHGGMQ